MSGKGSDLDKDAPFTVLIVRDVTKEPRQFRVRPTTIRRMVLGAGAVVALLVAIFVVVIPLKLRNAHEDYSALVKRTKRLTALESRYICSSDKLAALDGRLSSMESKVEDSCQRARLVIGGMEKDLRRWLPEGAAGGGSDSHEEESGEKDTLPLSPSQLKQINDLEGRLALLDLRLDSYEWTVTSLEKSWEKRSALFSALPSFWPVSGGHITSDFGMRFHPITHRLHMHEGIDIAAPYRTSVFAAAPGMVSFVGRRGGYGKSLTIDHGFGISTFYAHCRKIFVSPGDEVERGQRIAQVGKSGLTTGPHLHFEVRVKGAQVDPMQYLSVFSPGAEE